MSAMILLNFLVMFFFSGVFFGLNGFGRSLCERAYSHTAKQRFSIQVVDISSAFDGTF